MRTHLLVLAASCLGLASLALSQNPSPNQDCGEDSGPYRTGASAVEGSGSGLTQLSAQTEAISDLDRKLGIASGVVCDICDNGLQCERSVSAFGNEIEYEYEAGGGNLWDCTASFSGDYWVGCAACPDQF